MLPHEGLGEAWITWSGGVYRLIGIMPWPSEGYSRTAKQPSDWLEGADARTRTSSLSELGILRGLRMDRGQALRYDFSPKHKQN